MIILARTILDVTIRDKTKVDEIIFQEEGDVLDYFKIGSYFSQGQNYTLSKIPRVDNASSSSKADAQLFSI